jgi:hypothetical protein
MESPEIGQSTGGQKIDVRAANERPHDHTNAGAHSIN